MKKSRALLVIIALLPLLLTICAHNQKFDNVDDFRIAPLDDGKSAKIVKYSGTSQFVRIPPVIHGMAITEIGYEAFKDKEIISVTIPNSVSIIEYRAFIGNRLTSLIIPNSVTVIGEEAFAANDNEEEKRQALKALEKGYIGGEYGRGDDQIRYRNGISYGPFDDITFVPLCNKITNLTLGNNVTTIKTKAFYGNRLKSLVIPNSVITIDSEAFGKNELTRVIIGKSVTHLSGFEDNKLTDISIPNSVTYLSGFSNNNLSSIIVPNNVITIGVGAFAYNELVSVTIGKNVTTIEESAFRENSLKSIVIPNSVTKIEEQAFSSESNLLTRITIGSNVQLREHFKYFLEYGRPVIDGAPKPKYVSFGNGFDEYYENSANRIAGTYDRLINGRWVYIE